MVAIFEKTSADVVSVERVVSQKSASDARVSAYSWRGKGWMLAKGACVAGHLGSSEVQVRLCCGKHTKVIVAYVWG